MLSLKGDHRVKNGDERVYDHLSLLVRLLVEGSASLSFVHVLLLTMMLSRRRLTATYLSKGRRCSYTYVRVCLATQLEEGTSDAACMGGVCVVSNADCKSNRGEPAKLLFVGRGIESWEKRSR